MPIHDFFFCQSTLNTHLNCGILSSYLDSFADWLLKQGFPKSSICLHVSKVSHFSHFLKERSITSIESIDDHTNDFIHVHLPICSCKLWKKPRKGHRYLWSVKHFKEFISECHGIRFETKGYAHQTKTYAYPEIHDAYLQWLSEKRLLESISIESQSNHLKRFLNWYKTKSDLNDLLELKSCDIENYFIISRDRAGKAYKQCLKWTFRGFLDFCFKNGYTAGDLTDCLPTIRTYRLSDVPKAIDGKEAKKLLKSIDRSNKSGKRAYAVLQILYTYGVRGGQIRALKLEDINWHLEEIYFAPHKGGKGNVFPLTIEVGNALLDYLQNGRGESGHQEVFLTLTAPISPLKISKSLSQIVGREMLKAGIQSPSLGTHCFRHEFVSRLLKRGKSLKTVADMVGHRRLQTTFLYTKIDYLSLSEVALELPEDDNENL